FFVSITPEASRIGTTIKRLVEDDEQYVHVPPLGMGLGLEVIAEWMKLVGRTLTARQWDLVTKALAYCTLPLFVKLIYATVARKRENGKLLVSHALSYITAARSGLSDSEVEDLVR
uniref:Uncharacterized protein n=1 Tax=Parascaris equorum TaxID=6256 RepID=A0A914RS29_PAREQ